MTEPDFEQVRETLLEMRRLDPAARRARLAELRTTDPALAREIDSLLAHDHPANSEPDGDRISGVIRRGVRRLLASRAGPSLGALIGPYRLEALLGEGGMGRVYLATQEEPIRRQVALKLIQSGEHSPGFVQRFLAERQALALMEHPGIARVFDAGTTDEGLPYFAMELVRGEEITAYADRRRLGIDARVDLFGRLCDAIAHAHQKGVVHRDLKPSNVLVTESDGVGLPKVIDFGIAKALASPIDAAQSAPTEERAPATPRFAAGAGREPTSAGWVLGTPAYVAPEYLRRGQSDTRADVYSLGAMLHEMLVGAPFHDPQGPAPASCTEGDRRAPAAPSRRFADLDAGTQARHATACGSTPSTLERRLRGDLDAIVLKAAAWEPDARYQSVVELRQDLTRWRRHLPVEAAEAGAGYRFGKFLRRRRALIAVTAAVAVALIAGIVTTSWQAARARAAERVAEARRLAAEEESARRRALNDFVVDDLLRSADPMIDGRDVKVIDLLDNAALSLPRRFARDTRTRSAMHATLGRTYAGIGQYAKAIAQFDAALALETDAPYAREALEIRNGKALVLVASGAIDSARALAESVLEALHARGTPGDPIGIRAAAVLGNAHRMAGAVDSARAILGDAAARARSAFGSGAPEPYEIGLDYANVLPNGPEQIAYGEELLASVRRELGDDHVMTHSVAAELGLFRLNSGHDFPRAESLLTSALANFRRLLGPADLRIQTTANNLANAYGHQGRTREAIALLEQTAADIAANYGENAVLQSPILYALAIHQGRAGQHLAALRLYEQVEELTRPLPRCHAIRSRARLGIASELRALGRCGEGVDDAEASVADLMECRGRFAWEAQLCRLELARVYRCAGLRAKTEALLRDDARALEEEFDARSVLALMANLTLSESYRVWGDWEAASRSLGEYESRLRAWVTRDEPLAPHLGLIAIERRRILDRSAAPAELDLSAAAPAP